MSLSWSLFPAFTAVKDISLHFSFLPLFFIEIPIRGWYNQFKDLKQQEVNI